MFPFFVPTALKPKTAKKTAKKSTKKATAKTSVEEFTVDGIAVRLTRKRMKNTVLRVKTATGPVEVSAPYGTPRLAVEMFVRARRPWIEQRRRALKDDPMAAANEATPAQTKQWRKIVEAQAPDLIQKWSRIIGVHPSRIDYRNMKSRWGSCQPMTGRICLNTRLALYPPECLEYVVVHELCHMIEGNHGPRFYALMDRYLPDWRIRRAKLQSH